VGEAQHLLYLRFVPKLPPSFTPHTIMCGTMYITLQQAIDIACKPRYRLMSSFMRDDNSSDSHSRLVELHLNTAFKFPEKCPLKYIATSPVSEGEAAM
jgi:hypothetical protein